MIPQFIMIFISSLLVVLLSYPPLEYPSSSIVTPSSTSMGTRTNLLLPLLLLFPQQTSIASTVVLAVVSFSQPVRAITCVFPTCSHISPSDGGGTINQRTFVMTNIVTTFNSLSVIIDLVGMGAGSTMTFTFRSCTFIAGANRGLLVRGSPVISGVMTLSISTCTFLAPIFFDGRMPPSSTITMFSNTFQNSALSSMTTPINLGTVYSHIFISSLTMITTSFLFTGAYTVSSTTTTTSFSTTPSHSVTDSHTASSSPTVIVIHGY